MNFLAAALCGSGQRHGDEPSEYEPSDYAPRAPPKQRTAARAPHAAASPLAFIFDCAAPRPGDEQILTYDEAIRQGGEITTRRRSASASTTSSSKPEEIQWWEPVGEEDFKHATTGTSESSSDDGGAAPKWQSRARAPRQSFDAADVSTLLSGPRRGRGADITFVRSAREA
ncbi:hypothetical protein M885DRAFT_510044 [Pelagophyceae sp. CCMP2097]|nr:hypothetical protein M885DRAFT_510044 [Pelagophyceae sp. CCMP2097]